MNFPVPESFRHRAGGGEDRARWLSSLPRLVAEVFEQWQLQHDGDPQTGAVAVVWPVRTASGEPAAVKFGWPHPEAEHEHLALRAWNGIAAVRLLRADPRRSVLLLERADAAVDLQTIPVIEACEVAAGLYGRLHGPAVPQLRPLSRESARWAEQLRMLREQNLVPPRYLEQAIGLAADFAEDSQTDGRLIHTDLHYANVLAGQREATRAGTCGAETTTEWLVIDPKPLSGDPAYEVAPLLWNRWPEAVQTQNLRKAILDRFFAVVDTAGLDEERARGWVVVRELVNILWSVQSGDAVAPDWITRCTTIVKAVQR